MTNQIKSGGELKACPVCGSPALVGQTLDDAWYVMCQEDKCLRIDNYWPTKDEAIAAWLSRTPAKAGEDGDHIADAGKMVREAVREVLKWRVGELPDKGYIRDNDHSRAAIAKLAAALHGDQEG